MSRKRFVQFSVHQSLIAAICSAALSFGCSGKSKSADEPTFPGADEPAALLSMPCSYNSMTKELTVTVGNGETAIIAKSPSGDKLTANGSSCTASSTDKFVIVGTTGNGETSHVIVDYLYGAFAAGTATGAGISINLGDGTQDKVTIRGTKTGDKFVIGAGGAELTGDNKKDVSFLGVELVTVSSGPGDDTISAQGGTVVGGPFVGSCLLYGGEGKDTITGCGSATVGCGGTTSTLFGNAGNDTFKAGNVTDCVDTMSGGDGIDIADYSLRTVAVTASLDMTANDGTPGENDSIGVDIEGIRGSSAGDTLTGNDSANELYGMKGNDLLFALGGNDKLDGGDDDDILNGGLGDDTLIGGLGLDTQDYSDRTAAITVNWTTSAADDGDPLLSEKDLATSDVERVVGGSGNDNFTGNGLSNVLVGNMGNDTLNGAGGDDSLEGGAGNDTLEGGVGGDRLDGDVGTDSLSGGDGDDLLDGGTGVDAIDCGAGEADFYVPDNEIPFGCEFDTGGMIEAGLTISDGASYDFGVTTAALPLSKTFTVSNTSPVSTTLGTITTAGLGLAAPFALTGGTCTTGQMVASASSCTLTISFTPIAPSVVYSDTIVLPYDMTTTTRDISGSGAPPPVLTLSDGPTFSFGGVLSGGSIAKTFTLTNSGGWPAGGFGSFTTNNLSLAAPFTLTGGTCNSIGASLAAGASCTLIITFSPVSSGVLSDTLVVSYTDVAGATQTVSRSLSGTGQVQQQIWGANGSVYHSSLSADGASLYIGGTFSTLYGPTPYSAIIDLQNSFKPIPNSTSSEKRIIGPAYYAGVHSAVSDGAGGYFIGGEFTSVGGLSRSRVAHIFSDGSVDPNFDANCNATVRRLIRSNTRLYIFGEFTQCGGQTRNRLAAVSTSTGALEAFTANATGIIYDAVLSGTTLYVGGDFGTIGGQSRTRIAAINTTLDSSNVLPFNPTANIAVYSLALSGTTLYVGGNFSTIGGQTRARLAAIDTTMDTNNATAFDPGANDIVRSLLISGITLYAGGDFTMIGGASRNRIAAIITTMDTGNATMWDPNANDKVYFMMLDGTTMYAAGAFTSIGGATRNFFAGLSTTMNTGNATSFNIACPNMGQNPAEFGNAMVLDGTKMYVGGTFLKIGSVARANFAEISLATGEPTALAPNPNGVIYGAADDGAGKLYLAGSFSMVAATSRANLGAVNKSDGTILPWNPSTNSQIRSMVLSGSTVYIGGDFSSAGGATRNKVAAIGTGTNTNNATAWDPSPDGNVYVMALGGSGTMYLGGDFANVNGQARSKIAEVSLSNGSNTSWDPNSNAIVKSLHVTSDTVYAGGDFATIGGQTRARLAALLRSDGTATAWNPNPSGGGTQILGMTMEGNNLYVGGYFTAIGGLSRNHFAAVSTIMNTMNGFAAFDPTAHVTYMMYSITNIGSGRIVGGGNYASWLCSNVCLYKAGTAEPF